MGKVLRTALSLSIYSCLFLYGRAQAPSLDKSVPPSRQVTAAALPVDRQRALLLLSSTHFAVAKELQLDLDSSLIYAAHSLGISRLAVVSEGFPDTGRISSDRWFDDRDPATARKMLPLLKDNEHLRQMVLLGAYYCFQPAAWSRYKDSILFFLSRAREESRALHDRSWDRQILCLLGKTFVSGKEPETGDHFFDECLAECRLDGDKANEAKALMYRGLYTTFTPANTNSRIACLQKAAGLYNSLDRPVEASNCWIDIGYLHVSALDLKKGENAFKEAYRLQDSSGFAYTHYTTDNIAMAMIFQGKYGEPLKYCIQTVRIAETLKDSIDWGCFYERLGMLYNYLDNKSAESGAWLQKSIQRNTIADPDPNVYRALNVIVGSYAYEGRPADALALVQQTAAKFPPKSTANRLDYDILIGTCYTNLAQYELAEKYILEALQLEKQQELVRGNYDRAFVYTSAGHFYLKKGEYARARHYLEQSLSDPDHRASAIKNTLVTYRLLCSVDSATGHYDQAFRHLIIYTRLLDSSLNVQMGRQAEELAVQYQTEQKEADIKIRDQHIRMLQQADMLRQTSLHHAEFVRNMTIAGIIISLAIAGLLFWLYKQKQAAALVIGHKNELLESLLSEKDWLLKEVHHRVKNNLHTIICLLESQSKFLDSEALEALEDSRRRIYAMSLLHQKIYQADDIRTIDMDVYMPEFIHYLKESFGSPRQVYFHLDIAPLKLSITQAIPVVLILNEAVTNAIKHAFPGRMQGEIIIRLQKQGRRILLSIADNGIGMDPAIVNTELNSLGLSLMQGLSLELRGKITFERENGTTVSIIFEAGSAEAGLYAAEPRQTKEYIT